MIGPRKRQTMSTTKLTHKSKTQNSCISTFSRPPPTTVELLNKKYYQPVVAEEEKYRAFMISSHLRGFCQSDGLHLADTIKMHNSQQNLLKLYLSPLQSLRSLLELFPECQEWGRVRLSPLLPFSALAFRLVAANKKSKKAYVLYRTQFKKETIRSTQASCKKSTVVIDQWLKGPEESREVSKLTRCLKGVLNKYGSKKSYKQFIEQMGKVKAKEEKSQGLMKMILNLQQDVSSIRQEQNPAQFSKESIYGLSDLKKKSKLQLENHHKPKMQLESSAKLQLESRKATNRFLLPRLDFCRSKDPESNSRAVSTSKTSKKSVSLRKKAVNSSNTPDTRGKSKSRSYKKISLKSPLDKKNQVVDTQKLYFDCIPSGLVEKAQSKSGVSNKDSIVKSSQQDSAVKNNHQEVNSKQDGHKINNQGCVLQKHSRRLQLEGVRSRQSEAAKLKRKQLKR